MKKETQRQRKTEAERKWSLLCLVWLALWKYSFLALQKANIRSIESDGAEAGSVTVPYVSMATTKPTDDVR